MKKQIQFSVLGFAILSLCAIGSNLQASDDTEKRAPTKSEEQASFAEYNAIVAALKPYIDGAKTGDGALIRSNFSPMLESLVPSTAKWKNLPRMNLKRSSMASALRRG